MVIWLLTLVHMLWLYIVLISLYWIKLFQLYIAYIISIHVIWYSFNGAAIAQLLIDYQSISLFISNCSIAIVSKAIQLLVICYMSIDIIQLKQLQFNCQLKNTIGLTAQLIRSRHPKVPPLQFFLQIRI